MRKLFVPMLVGLGLALYGCSQFRSARMPTDRQLALVRGPVVGQMAPEIDGEDLEGTRFKLSDYRGKVVVLDFWGNW
jgi:AhpC/TSA family